MSMLCTACDRKQSCLAAALAQEDEALLKLLQDLKTCDMKPAASPKPNLFLKTCRSWFTPKPRPTPRNA